MAIHLVGRFLIFSQSCAGNTFSSHMHPEYIVFSGGLGCNMIADNSSS